MENAQEQDQTLLALRPMINIEDTEENADAYFQNHTLRQVLKMKNAPLLAICKDILNQRHKNFESRDQNIKETFVEDLLKTDQNLKQFLCGMVAGQFTTDELSYYLQHKNEVNKRITLLIIKRVKDQI